MSRSIGDYVAHSVGVIAEPEVDKYELQAGDLAMVIASDGVFEFLSNKIVASIVLKNLKDPEKAVNEIVLTADKAWK